MRSPRRNVPVGLAALAVLTALSGCGSGAAADRPSVILVTLDTTRPDFFGCYGHPGGHTPSFDALAAEGTRFSHAVTSSALTPVAHASILTGLYQYGHGLRVIAAPGGCKLPADVPTLATLLKRRGYRTAAIHSAFPVSGTFGLTRDFDHVDDIKVEITPRAGGRIGWDTFDAQRRSDATTRRVLDYLEGAREPFFLWIHYWDPHDPELVPPPEFVPADIPKISGRDKDGREVEGYAKDSRIYAVELQYVDSQFGRVLAALKARGTYDQTLIAVVADHGEGLEDGERDHGWAAHRILYEEQIHVPLILRLPGAPAGRVVDELVRTVDLFPTLLDYADVAGPAVHGRSLRALVEGRADAPRTAYADQVNAFDLHAVMLQARPQADFLYCAMDARWKLIYRPTAPASSELYDLESDPDELQNLFEREPAQALRLLRELARSDGWVTRMFAGEALTEEELLLLEGLGYTGTGEDQRGPDPNWRWSCPADGELADERGACARCGGPLVLVKR